MALTTEQLASRLAVLHLEFDGEDVRVIYREGACTPAWLVDTVTEPVRSMLARVLEDWNVEGPDGQIYRPALGEDWEPLLLELPQTFLSDLLDAIVTDVRTRRPRGEQAKTPRWLEPLSRFVITA